MCGASSLVIPMHENSTPNRDGLVSGQKQRTCEADRDHTELREVEAWRSLQNSYKQVRQALLVRCDAAVLFSQNGSKNVPLEDLASPNIRVYEHQVEAYVPVMRHYDHS
jgi:hypothetical protein